MVDIIEAGAILIKDGTFLPNALRLESESCVPGWRLVKNLDKYGFGQKIGEAGWTFFCLGAEIRATVFGIDREKMARRAIERILARLGSEKCNSLEVVRVAYVASERFLGVSNVTVSAQSRHIQESLFLEAKQ